MLSALIVSASEVTQGKLKQMLMQDNFIELATVNSCSEARRFLSERDFDLCVINTPLLDEFGVNLARSISAERTTQVIVLVSSSIFDEISNKTEDVGVLTVSKPLTHDSFWHAIKIAKAVHNKINKLKTENERLLTTIDDIRIIDRAKYLLIETMKMSEQEAHRYIEKQSMDLRITKKAVALNVIKTYEN